MAHISSDVRSLAREHTKEAILRLARLMRHAESESVQMGSAALLLERGWGKPPATLTGADGDGPVQVIVRHIVRGVVTEERPLIDVTKNDDD